jgi:pimeloyl-ACP methyl ester carboxylesterase
LFKKRENDINNTQNTPQSTEEIFTQEPTIDKIELSVTTKNGVEYYQSNIAKLDGGKEVLLIIVGMNGSVYGYENKYFRIAKRANAIYGSTVFIFSNNERNWYNSEYFFDAVMNYARQNTANQTDSKIKLFGVSAGAAFASFYAWKYPEITTLLLVNPPLVNCLELTMSGIRSFSGDATLVVGKNDTNYKLGELFTLDKYNDIFKNVVLYDGADHSFTGLLKEFIDLPFQYLYDRMSIYV